MKVEIAVELWDQIERYLEQRAAQQDGEAAQLLMALEAAEIGRTMQVYGLINSESESVQAVFTEVGTITWESFVTSQLPLLRLPPEILEALQSGKIAYTKAQAIARVKDDNQRKELLEEAIVQDLSLSQIKEKVAILKSPKIDVEAEPSLRSQIDDVLRQSKRSKVWDDPKKQRKLEKILADLKTLVGGAE